MKLLSSSLKLQIQTTVTSYVACVLGTVCFPAIVNSQDTIQSSSPAAAATTTGRASDEPGKASPSGAASSATSSDQPFETMGVANPKMVVGYVNDPAANRIVSWMMESREGLAIIDGDIVLGTEQELTNKADETNLKGLTDVRSKLWPKGKVPYDVPQGFPHRDAVMKAFDEFNTRTKIKFAPRTEQTKDYLQFTLTDNPNVGGQSYLGRKGGAQVLWMNRDPAKWNTGTVIHELGHALGLVHEQCRGDREQYVDIVWGNILPGYESQFVQLFSNGRDLGAYDYDSILHYPKNAFARPGTTTTIVPKRSGVAIGQRSHLSETDIKGLHELYAKELQ